jgi:hypothetical protein
MAVRPVCGRSPVPGRAGPCRSAARIATRWSRHRRRVTADAGVRRRMARPGLEPGTPRFSGEPRPFPVVAADCRCPPILGISCLASSVDCRQIPPPVSQLLASWRMSPSRYRRAISLRCAGCPKNRSCTSARPTSYTVRTAQAGMSSWKPVSGWSRSGLPGFATAVGRT